MNPTRALCFLLILALPSGVVFAQVSDPRAPILADESVHRAPVPTWVDQWNKIFRPASVLENQMVVAFYGQPSSTKMGILGEQGLEESKRKLDETIKTWEAVSGGKTVLAAFHLIFATCYPDANVGLLTQATVLRYVEFAAENNMIVILDHQLGLYSIEAAMNSMLPYLKYPNVHLAIDPEWKTPNPGIELGTITAAEVNKAEQMMDDYLAAENLPGKRMLILHQFHAKMISARDTVRSDFPRVDLVHHADGFGPPQLKLDTYKFLAGMKNLPVKGFKLFLPKSWKSKGMDIPLLTPAQVMALAPQPVYISYQ
jgi:hypothetical protein